MIFAKTKISQALNVWAKMMEVHALVYRLVTRDFKVTVPKSDQLTALSEPAHKAKFDLYFKDFTTQMEEISREYLGLHYKLQARKESHRYITILDLLAGLEKEIEQGGTQGIPTLEPDTLEKFNKKR